jgi:hypothetical protein
MASRYLAGLAMAGRMAAHLESIGR